jgi:hypothetical protein
MDDDGDYIMRVIAARCGDVIASAVVPAVIVERIADAIDAVRFRLDELMSG